MTPCGDSSRPRVERSVSSSPKTFRSRPRARHETPGLTALRHGEATPELKPKSIPERRRGGVAVAGAGAGERNMFGAVPARKMMKAIAGPRIEEWRQRVYPRAAPPATLGLVDVDASRQVFQLHHLRFSRGQDVGGYSLVSRWMVSVHGGCLHHHSRGSFISAAWPSALRVFRTTLRRTFEYLRAAPAGAVAMR